MLVEPRTEGVGLPVELGGYISRQAWGEGPSRSAIWPGLTFYRFEQRVALHWNEVGSASLCMVVQGRKRLRIGSANYFYDPLHYLVIKRGLSFQAEILQASRERPFLSFVLQMQPDMVAGRTPRRARDVDTDRRRGCRVTRPVRGARALRESSPGCRNPTSTCPRSAGASSPTPGRSRWSESTRR